jgi:hypothetical protein
VPRGVLPVVDRTPRRRDRRPRRGPGLGRGGLGGRLHRLADRLRGFPLTSGGPTGPSQAGKPDARRTDAGRGQGGAIRSAWTGWRASCSAASGPARTERAAGRPVPGG